VCDCESVLKPKPVESIKIVYKKKKEKTISKDNNEISPEILNRCCETLIPYGFDKEEAEQLIRKAYSIDKNADCIKLVKMVIFDFGGKNG